MASSDSAPSTASAGIVPGTGDDGITIDTQAATRVAAPANNAAEIATHTGALNVLDPYFYTHFMRFASFSWTTSELAGHSLYSVTLDPSRLHKNLAYVLKLYNQWAGGLELKLEIAGTGFNGGKLLFVRYPPNVDPSSFSVDEATVFNSVMLDPKAQNSTILAVEDFRSTLFHWNNTFEDGYGKISNSMGTLSILVMLPLITSGVGLGSVNLQLSCRLSPSFAIGQMIPAPRTLTAVTGVSEAFLAINKTLHLLPDFAYRRGDMPLKYIQVLPTSTVAWQGIDSLVGCSGIGMKEEVSTTHSICPSYLIQITSALQYINVRDKRWLCFADWPGVPAQTRRLALTNNGPDDARWFLISLSNDTAFYFYVSESCIIDTSTQWLIRPQKTELGTDEITTLACGPASAYPDYKTEYIKFITPIDVEGSSITAPNGESIVTFGFSNTETLGMLNTSHFADHFRAGEFTRYGKGGLTPVFTVHDLVTQTPIARWRLNSAGFFSTNKVTILTSFRIEDTYLKYEMDLPLATPLPQVAPAVASNVLYVQMTNKMRELEDKLNQTRGKTSTPSIKATLSEALAS